MSTKLHIVKEQIRELYKRKAPLHISLAVNHAKLHLKKFKAEITGVYPNLFSVETLASEKKEKHILQYVDILSGNIDISELGNNAEN